MEDMSKEDEKMGGEFLKNLPWMRSEKDRRSAVILSATEFIARLVVPTDTRPGAHTHHCMLFVDMLLTMLSDAELEAYEKEPKVGDGQALFLKFKAFILQRRADIEKAIRDWVEKPRRN